VTHDLSIPRDGRLVERLGHFSPEILIAAIFGVIIVGLHPLAGPLMLTVPVALLAVVLGSWLLMRRHDRQLCEFCVASMPLNPSQRAQHFRTRFWLCHVGAERRFLIPYVIVLIGSNFVPGTVGRVFWALVQTSMAYLILSHSTHRRLQPWCPWCSAGGGGSAHEDPVAPEPSPEDHRQLI
jgi:hypothetical protein